ncbi:MAG: M23 family metallopeptidase [Bacteroidia bacterium]|nr:M23 family metallopeptidase [Bacteroidia bacterium]MDW8334733.1 M23 family metallopeptidase [Bacteroidia bacterium]
MGLNLKKLVRDVGAFLKRMYLPPGEIYYYDSDTFTYTRRKKNWAYWTKWTFRHAAILSLSTAAMVGLYFWIFDSPEARLLKWQNEKLRDSSAFYARKVETLKRDLQALKETDKNIYRAILNAEPLPETQDRDSARKPISDAEIEAQIRALDEQLSKNTQLQALLLEVGKKNKNELSKIPAIRPVRTEILCGFGKKKSPLSGKDKHHDGVDFRADVGTEVMATGDGWVVEAGHAGKGGGLTVAVNHGYGYVSRYSCLKEIFVYVGKRVKRGEVIAKSGNSGVSKGPHLHYSVYKNGVAVDPIDYFYSDLSSEEYVRYREAAARYNESMD